MCIPDLQLVMDRWQLKMAGKRFLACKAQFPWKRNFWLPA